MIWNETLWLMCFLKDAQDLCHFIFLQYESFYLSISDTLKILWAVALTSGMTRAWVGKYMALADVCMWSVQPAWSWSPASVWCLQWAAVQPRAEEKAVVLFGFHCHSAQKHLVRRSLGWERIEMSCTPCNNELFLWDETELVTKDKNTKKQCEGSRWRAMSQHRAAQGWLFSTCGNKEILMERAEGAEEVTLEMLEVHCSWQKGWSRCCVFVVSGCWRLKSPAEVMPTACFTVWNERWQGRDRQKGLGSEGVFCLIQHRRRSQKRTDREGYVV